MTELNADDVIGAVRIAADSRHECRGVTYLTPDDDLIQHTLERTVKYTMSTARCHVQWLRLGN